MENFCKMEDAGIREILIDLGFLDLTDNGDYYRMTPIYRESSNPTSLSVNKVSGKWSDFGISESGGFPDLIKKVIGTEKNEEVESFLKKRNLSFISEIVSENKRFETESVDESFKVFDSREIEDLEPIHTYWEDRNIDLETLKTFGGGVRRFGKLKDRYVFPIFTEESKIVGFSARDLINDKKNKKRPKWKILGKKNKFVYPTFLNLNDIIDAKEVILVESIGDCLTLFSNGIKNVLVLFGLNINLEVLNLLLKLNPKKIVIALNNDERNSGNIACKKAKNKLLRYFDENQILIHQTEKNDFNEMNNEEIKEWKSGI